MSDHRPILIVGPPRSGTTWIGEVLSSARHTTYLFEPDNEGLSPLAWLCKRHMHRFPYLGSGDTADEYHQLWRAVMNGSASTWWANNALGLLFRRQAFALEASIGEKCGLVYVDSTMHRVGQPKCVKPYSLDAHPVISLLIRSLLARRAAHVPKSRLVIKSVHASLSLEWIVAHFPVRVILVLRNPFSLYASYRRLKLPDGYRNPLLQERLQRDWLGYAPVTQRTFMPDHEDHLILQIMLMYKIIERQASRHPDWLLLSHDRLCMAPHEGYDLTFRALDLPWRAETERKIESLSGTGERFDPKRISQNEPTKWKREMSTGEALRLERWTEAFDLGDFFERNVNPP